MPQWLIISLVVLLVAPGVAIILFGVYALFRASGPGAPVTQRDASPDAEPHAPSMSFSSSPVPPLTIDSVDTPPAMETVDAGLLAAGAEPVIDAEVEGAGSGPMLPAPEADDKDVT